MCIITRNNIYACFYVDDWCARETAMGVKYGYRRGVRARPTCQKHVNDPFKGRFWCRRQEQKRLEGIIPRLLWYPLGKGNVRTYRCRRSRICDCRIFGSHADITRSFRDDNKTSNRKSDYSIITVTLIIEVADWKIGNRRAILAVSFVDLQSKQKSITCIRTVNVSETRTFSLNYWVFQLSSFYCCRLLEVWKRGHSNYIHSPLSCTIFNLRV